MGCCVVYRSFEDLEVWKKACALSVDVYRQLSDCKDFGLKNQMTRAAVSIASNIAEGKERETINEFIRFLYYAKGSTGEVRTQLHIARNIEYINMDEFQKLSDRFARIGGMIGNLIKALRKNK